MVRIVEFKLQDIDSFYRCFETIMQEGYAGFSKPLIEFFIRKEYSKNNFYLWVERNFRKIFLAINENNDIIGFLVGDNTYGGVAFITWIGVLKEYRSKGIGKLLFETYENYIRGLRAHIIELFTYEAVKGFYENLGFVEIGRRRQGFFGQKNIIMDKTIGSWDDKYIPAIKEL
jgi:ribosomal protein S18 acetylase RimI-like enzyme